jgi:hypothetical protein
MLTYIYTFTMFKIINTQTCTHVGRWFEIALMTDHLEDLKQQCTNHAYTKTSAFRHIRGAKVHSAASELGIDTSMMMHGMLATGLLNIGKSSGSQGRFCISTHLIIFRKAD